MKILLVDDHDIIFPGIIAEAEKMFKQNEIKTATSFKAAKEVLKLFEPDVVITDIFMEESDSGIKLCRYLRTNFPETKIIIFTQFDTPFNIYEAYLMDIIVFLDKVYLRRDFKNAMKAALENKKFYTEHVNEIIFNYFEKHNGSLPSDKIPILTPVKAEYLKLFAAGYNDSEIEKKLHVTKNTIKSNRQDLYLAFGIEGHGRTKITKLIAKARELGFV